MWRGGRRSTQPRPQLPHTSHPFPHTTAPARPWPGHTAPPRCSSFCWAAPRYAPARGGRSRTCFHRTREKAQPSQEALLPFQCRAGQASSSEAARCPQSRARPQLCALLLTAPHQALVRGPGSHSTLARARNGLVRSLPRVLLKERKKERPTPVARRALRGPLLLLRATDASVCSARATVGVALAEHRTPPPSSDVGHARQLCVSPALLAAFTDVHPCSKRLLTLRRGVLSTLDKDTGEAIG